MAKEFGRWFRFYDGVLDDPKVQRLPDHLFRAWVNLMCLANRCGGRIEADYADIGFSLRKSEGEAREILQALASAGLMDIEETVIEPHNWTERQFKTDGDDPTGAERQRRWRERNKPTVSNDVVTDERNAVTPVTVTATRAETEQNRTESETENNTIGALAAPAKPNGVHRSKPEFPTADDMREATSHWNTLASELGLPQVERLTDKRSRHLRARLLELEGLGPWFGVVNSIRDSPFLRGQKTDWRCDFDWLINAANFQKVIEGKYAEKGKAHASH